ncbi:MAG: hypothetical protein ABIW50_08680 [Candidatus Limnocylindria bacterium]
MEPEPEPEPEGEPDQEVEPDPEAGQDADGEPDLAPESPTPSFEPDTPRPSWVPASPWSRRSSEPEPEPEPAPAPTAEPESGPEPELEPEPEPAPEADVEFLPDAGPESTSPAVPDWLGDAPWPDRGESTQVLPSTWAPSEPTATEPDPGLVPVAGRIKVSAAPADAAEPEEEPTTAEQAVPWLIGIILLLAGMVIVLMALIFAGDASVGSSGAVPSGSEAIPTHDLVGASSSETPTATPAATSPTAAPSSSPTLPPVPEYGALEMVYQGRSAALAPIYLLRRDFTKDVDTQEVLAQDPTLDVRYFAWARDGTVGAGLLADVLVSIEPGKEKRRLADGISSIAFGPDGSTVYAARITDDGANDVATIFAIDFLSGESTEVTAISYTRPSLGAEEALAEAQFTDEGGPVRLYWLEDGTLRFWALGGGNWRVNPADGQVTAIDGDAVPALWSPDGDQRIRMAYSGGETSIALTDESDTELEAVSVTGRVSHLRWAPDGERVVFTVGRSASGGGVLQDLFLWDLNEADPMQLTATGAAFGAEWLGTRPLWRN